MRGGDSISGKEIIALSNKKMITLSDASDNDNTIKKAIMLITTLDEPNLNGTIITKENALEHMDTLVNKPCLAYYYVDEDGIERLGDHEFTIEEDEDGNIIGAHFNTTPIGVFTRVWIDKVGKYDNNVSSIDKNKDAIFAEAILWSERFPNTMRVIEDMFNNGTSVSSYEIDVYKSKTTIEGKSLIDFAFIGHTLLGVPPACPVSGIKELSQLNEDKIIISNALRKDLKINKVNKINKEKSSEEANKENKERGKKDMGNDKENKATFNKVVANKDNFFKMLASLTDNDLRSKVWKAVNDTDDNEWYYLTYIIPYEYKAYAKTYNMDETEFIEFTYKVNSDDTITIESQKNVNMKFVPEDDSNSSTSGTDTASLEAIKALKNSLSEKEHLFNKVNKELSEKNDAIVDMGNQLKDKEKIISDKEKEISELVPFKKQIEETKKAEKEKEMAEKRDKLKKFAIESGYIKEDEFKTSKELSEALKNVDEKTIKAEIADRVIAVQKEAKKKEVADRAKKEAEAKSKVETSSKTTDNKRIPNFDVNKTTKTHHKEDSFKIIEEFLND